MKQSFSLRTYLLHLGLFLLAWATTMLSGAELITGHSWLGDLQAADFWEGWPYSLAFLTFLTCHEFGHYFMALFHRVRSSLPFYIPVYIPFLGLNIGSLGAVIMLKQMPDSTRKYFDIGIAGPLAGFVVSLGLLFYGFTHLPPLEETVFAIHPDYVEEFGRVPAEPEMVQWLKDQDLQSVAIGSSLLFDWLAETLPSDQSQVPPAYEIMHYPFLFVGFITLFFTALNLLPIGQLDGGHVIYGMFGRRTAGLIARVSTVGLLLLGGTGLLGLQDLDQVGFLSMGAYLMFVIYVFTHILGRNRWQPVALAAALLFAVQIGIKWAFPSIETNPLWLLYSFLVIRVIKLDHPKAFFEHRVNRPRQVLGWLAIAMFVGCFTPQPLRIIGETDPEALERGLERLQQQEQPEGQPSPAPEEAPEQDATKRPQEYVSG
jgi:membrane-associated protease RseP (regulator of RpoE activity)